MKILPSQEQGLIKNQATYIEELRATIDKQKKEMVLLNKIIWMRLERANKQDEKIIENWKKDNKK